MCSFIRWISPRTRVGSYMCTFKEDKYNLHRKICIPWLLGSEKHLFPQKFSLRLFVLLYIGKGVRNKSIIYCLNNLPIFYPWNSTHQTATAILLFTYFLPVQDRQCDEHELGDQKPSQWSCLHVATVLKHSKAAWTIFKFSENGMKRNTQPTLEPAAWGSYK